MISITLPFI